ncbi:flagellin [Spongiibacter taiwanensis]|uniref:flagellin N-terminal helical domain-containing protein n=1 Tax=Spongiibacter taiwanensis TaxID=1748242 RepID=UPI0025577ADD|nr:flagellin [Spongiibacter taiwanensis]
MALSINTNVASLNAQRNLSRSQDTLNTSLQRLSTGLRINSAKDDAAGLAISTRFTTQINGLNQAVRNANDGISLAQTGEAALDEITNNLQRIRELAVQSANSTYSASDRAALDAEVQQRLAEIDRIGGQTAFNGTKILDGTFGTATFQVGANVGETISVNLTTGVKSTQMGQIATATGGAVTANALTDGGLTIAVGSNAAVSVQASVAGSDNGQAATSAYAKAVAINSSGVPGLTATASNSVVDDGFTDITAGDTGADTYDLTINSVNIYSSYDLTGGDITASDMAAQINLYSNQTGVTASYDSVADELTLSTADGRNIDVTSTLTNVGGGTAPAGGFSTDVATNNTGTLTNNRGTISLTSTENIAMTGQFADIGHANSITKDTSTLSSVSVSTVAGSNDTISRIDAALTTVSDLRSTFGAVQNRFESTITNLQTISENLSASRGRILDADFAAETANLTKAQILQQAGTAILAQANSLPQSVLSLLQ